MNWFLEHVADFVGSIFNVIWGYLCSLIYGFIVVLFNLFTSMTQLDILEQSTINGIYQRITMIMTIVMVFYITFEFVKYVVSPDTIIDKEKGAGNIVKRIIISIVLIAFIPNIFSIAMELQDKILKTNVISKVIFGQEDFDYKTAGSNFAGDTFAAFYRVDCDEDCTESDREEAQKRVDDVIDTFKKDMGLYAITKGIAFDNIDGDIQFDGLLAVLFGGFTLYILFLYCMDLGIRYIKLIFLQIIAPIAAISYILPQKDGMLQKWSKQTLTTYVDVFLRIAILYFMLLIVSILSTNLDFFEMTASGQQINIFMHILIIMGLLIFVNKAPKLIEELLPFKSGEASIGFGFSGKSRFEPLGKSISTIKKPFAAATGIATGIGRTFKSMKAGTLLSNSLKNKEGIRGKLGRAATYATAMGKAAGKGAAAGAKNGRFSEAMSAVNRSVQGDEKVVNDGGTVLGSTFRGSHYQDEKVKVQMEIENLEAISKAKEEITNRAKDMKVMKTWESYSADWLNRGIGDASIRAKGQKDIEKALNAYAVSERNNQDKAKLNLAIETAVKNVYGLPATGQLSAEQQTLYNTEVKNIIQNIQNNAEFGSAKYDTLATSVKEMERIATGREFIPDGSNTPVKVGDSATREQFVQKIGDIADAALSEVAEIKAKEETRKANANASESKGSN